MILSGKRILLLIGGGIAPTQITRPDPQADVSAARPSAP